MFQCACRPVPSGNLMGTYKESTRPRSAKRNAKDLICKQVLFNYLGEKGYNEVGMRDNSLFITRGSCHGMGTPLIILFNILYCAHVFRHGETIYLFGGELPFVYLDSSQWGSGRSTRGASRSQATQK